MKTFCVEYDKRNGIIHCSCSGFLLVGDVDDYHAAVLAAMAEARRDRGFVKMIVISIDSRVQSGEVMERALQLLWPMAHPNDRMALIVDSSLAKLLASRLMDTDQRKAFLSESAALTWLMADQQAAASSQRAAART